MYLIYKVWFRLLVKVNANKYFSLRVSQSFPFLKSGNFNSRKIYLTSFAPRLLKKSAPLYSITLLI